LHGIEEPFKFFSPDMMDTAFINALDMLGLMEKQVEKACNGFALLMSRSTGEAQHHAGLTGHPRPSKHLLEPVPYLS